MENIIVEINEKANIEVINFNGIAWIRWHLPDFSDNGNIDLPNGKYDIKERKGNKVIIKRVKD